MCVQTHMHTLACTPAYTHETFFACTHIYLPPNSDLLAYALADADVHEHMLVLLHKNIRIGQGGGWWGQIRDLSDVIKRTITS